MIARLAMVGPCPEVQRRGVRPILVAVVDGGEALPFRVDRDDVEDRRHRAGGYACASSDGHDRGLSCSATADALLLTVDRLVPRAETTVHEARRVERDHVRGRLDEARYVDDQIGGSLGENATGPSRTLVRCRRGTCTLTPMPFS
jgi:hypothetical protein